MTITTYFFIYDDSHVPQNKRNERTINKKTQKRAKRKETSVNIRFIP